MNKLIFDSSGDKLIYRISNADGKVWYVPDTNSKIELQLYQPSSINGKLLKSFFPVIKRFSFIRNLLGISVHKYAVQSFLCELLCKIYKVENIEVSAFYGTPSVHQKITMQVTDESNILGYCKISDKEEIKALFRHEETILKTLYDCGIMGVPKCLYNGVLKDQAHIFAQTTTKTKNSKDFHHLSDKHWNFLSQLQQKTKTCLPFEESDFYQALQILKKNLIHLSDFDENAVKAAIIQAEEYYKGKRVEFSYYHSDFTPWNMFLEKGELFVFDWEYAKRTFPHFLDAFHFFTQVSIYEKHKNAKEIMVTYHVKRMMFVKYFENPEFSYKCYLLSMISLYLHRDNGAFSEVVVNNFRLWTKLLQLLQKKK